MPELCQKFYFENGKSYQFNLNLWWSGRTKGFKRTRKIDFRVARVATSKKCQKCQNAKSMPKCYLENGKRYQFDSTLWWSGRTKEFKRTRKIDLRVATSKKCQKYNLGFPELCQNAISRTVRAIKKIQLCGGPVGQMDSKEQEKSNSGLPGLPLQKDFKKC